MQPQSETQNKTTNSFSFAQFLVVVAIIGILTAIAIPAYGEYTSKAKAQRMLKDVRELQAAVANYRGINGSFVDAEDGELIKKEYGVEDPVTYSDVINKTEVNANGKNKVTIYIVGSGASLSLRQGQSLQLDLHGVWSQERGVEWECRSTGQTKYAPTSCKPYTKEIGKKEAASRE